jgi:hypothetical protein
MNNSTISAENMKIMQSFRRGFIEFQQIIKGEKIGIPLEVSLKKWDKWAEEIEEEDKPVNE